MERHGRNVIEVAVPPWWVLLGREATNPFTIFQASLAGRVAPSINGLTRAGAGGVGAATPRPRSLLATRHYPAQVWAIAVWLLEEYYLFSVFIAATAAASTLSAFWDVRKNLLDIQRISRFTAPVRVWRGGAAPVTVDSSALVPGDVLVIEQV